jgi:hypothetical protein
LDVVAERSLTQYPMPVCEEVGIRSSDNRIVGPIVEEHSLQRTLDDVSSVVGNSVVPPRATKSQCIVDVFSSSLRVVVQTDGEARHVT